MVQRAKLLASQINATKLETLERELGDRVWSWTEGEPLASFLAERMAAVEIATGSERKPGDQERNRAVDVACRHLYMSVESARQERQKEVPDPRIVAFLEQHYATLQAAFEGANEGREQ